MSQFRLNTAVASMESKIAKLKWAFYEWLGALSIDEIMNNAGLMECVQRVERLMRQLAT